MDLGPYARSLWTQSQRWETVLKPDQNVKSIAITGILGAFLGLASACSSSVHEGATHGLACRTSADCHTGQTCESEKCVEPRADSGTAPRIENPTGTCVAPDTGARPGYASPEPGTAWLPDCKSSLTREYWRVFATSRTSAYILPRPDGAPELLASACEADQHPLQALVKRYSLCASAPDPATVDRINDMAPADALEITHYLHTQLVFQAAEGIPNVDILPFPIPGDVMDACALHPDQLSAELQAGCDAEAQFVKTGVEPVPSFSATASELAPLLNELYGIGQGCLAGESPDRVCAACNTAPLSTTRVLSVLVGCAESQVLCTHPCTTSDDCAGVTAGTACDGVCAPAAGCHPPPCTQGFCF